MGSSFYTAIAETRREKLFNPRAEKVLNITKDYDVYPCKQVYDVGGGLILDSPIAYTEQDFDDQNALIEAIVLERHAEFVMEGQRFFDLIRLRREINGLPYDSQKLRYPIPQIELDQNNNLVQNPGY